MFCVYCSKEMAPGSVMCGSCGKSLKERLLRCRNCGYQAIEGDRFCLRCSTEIEFMHAEMKPARPTFAAPRAEEIAEIKYAPPVPAVPIANEAVAEIKYAPPVPAAPIAEEAKLETMHTSYVFEAPKPEEIKTAERFPKPALSPPVGISRTSPPDDHPPKQDDPKIVRERKPKRLSRFAIAWLIFILIALGTAFVVFWYFDEISSFFQAEGDSQNIDVIMETAPHEVILPHEIQVIEEPSNEPEAEPDLQGSLPVVFTSTIATGTGHCLVISETGHLWSWGTNASGQLGIGSTEEFLQPVLVMNDAKSVYAVLDRTFVICEDGTLWSFGNNERGQLGDGTTTNRYLPVQVMERVIFVSLTDDATFAITEDNKFWAWGANDAGQLGDGTTTDRLSPTLIRTDGLDFALETGLIGNIPPWHGEDITIDGEQIVYIAASQYASLALTEGGYVWELHGNAFDAIERWDEYEYEFFVVMTDVRQPTGLAP